MGQDEKDSKNTDSYTSRGIAKARLGNLTEAIVDFDVALELNPKDGNAYFNHGMAMEMSGEVQRACLDWEHSVELGHEQAINFVRKYCS